MTTTEPDADAIPPLKPAERYPRLETDVFCVECGYNLHSQPVTRDERLGIFICRCPECGRFHPAGVGITAARPWMNRLATALLVFWVLIVMNAFIWAGVGMGTVMVAHVETQTYRKAVTMDGQPAEWKNITNGPRTGFQVVRKGTTQPVGWRYAYSLTKPEDDGRHIVWDNAQTEYNRRMQRLIFASASAGLSLISGMLLAMFLWHWPRGRYRWAALLPFASGAVLLVIFRVNLEYNDVFGWSIAVVLGYALWQGVWITIGTLLGRPVARGLLRMFVPPKARQHFAFLWSVDGKSMPINPRTPAL